MIIKEEFDQILRDYGHDIYLRRRRTTVGSGPYMNVSGGMYEINIERWTTYRVLQKGMNIGLEPLDEGLVSEADAVFYLSQESVPKTDDLIIEETPHERSNREVYMINRAIPYYFGTIVTYYAAYCTRIEPVS
jgi:hypothetical protein